MPIAEKFKALGAGNGFPFCLEKVDVSIYDNWITLGGVSSGTATQQQINESLKNAIKLYWNLYSGTGSFATSVGAASGNYSVSEQGVEIILKNNEEALQPSKRVYRGTDDNSLYRLVSQINQSDEPLDSPIACYGFLRLGSDYKFIVRMYNGSTEDESNFVGYGVNQLFTCRTYGSTSEGTAYSSVQIDIASFLFGTNDSGTDLDGSKYDTKVFQTTLDGIPFRSKTSSYAGSSGGGGVNITVSASERSGTAECVVTGEGYSFSSSSTASLSSIDFWTY